MVERLHPPVAQGEKLVFRSIGRRAFANADRGLVTRKSSQPSWRLVDRENWGFRQGVYATDHLAPRSPGITFIQPFDQAAGQGNLHVGVLAGHGDQALARKSPLQSL